MSQELHCCICRKSIPENRAKRKSFACVTCSDECYSALRTMRRNLRRQKGWYVPKSKRAKFERWLAESTKVPPDAQQPLTELCAVRNDTPTESSSPNV